MRREDAEKCRDEHNQLLFGRDPNKVPVRTHLSVKQVRDVETAFALIPSSAPSMSLLDVVDFHKKLAPAVHNEDAAAVAQRLVKLRERGGALSLCDILTLLTRYRSAPAEVTLSEALEWYLTARKRETKARSKHPTRSDIQYNSIAFEMHRFEAFFGGDRPLRVLSAQDRQKYLLSTFPRDSEGEALFPNKTWKNRRGYLTTFFKFCIEENGMAKNPAKGSGSSQGGQS